MSTRRRPPGQPLTGFIPGDATLPPAGTAPAAAGEHGRPARAADDYLATQGRVDYRMLTDEKPVASEVREQLLAELHDWRIDRGQGDQPVPLARLAEQIGVSGSTLSEVIAGKYRGDADGVLRKLDQFLADEHARAKRHDVRKHVQIGLTTKIFGAIRTGVQNNTCPVIIVPPGGGKTIHAQAFARTRSGVVLIRCEDEPTGKRVVSELICRAVRELHGEAEKLHRRRVASIQLYQRTHRNMVLVVDECQKLSMAGLELLRDLHDVSDPDGRRNMPIVFFGDERFLSLLNKGASSHASPVSAQMIRRLIPVYDVVAEARGEDGGGDIYSVADIVKIIDNVRLRLVTQRGLRWLHMLANVYVQGYGLLGLAMQVLQLALDLRDKSGDGGAVDVERLQQAVNMTAGRSVAAILDAATDGELLRRATA